MLYDMPRLEKTIEGKERVMSEFGFLLSALSLTSRLCMKNIDNFSQRRKEEPKPQSKLRLRRYQGAIKIESKTTLY